MKPNIDKDGNWGCPLWEESLDANSNWMATNFKHHMLVHARRGETN